MSSPGHWDVDSKMDFEVQGFLCFVLFYLREKGGSNTFKRRKM